MAAMLNAEIRDQFLDLIAPWITYTPAWTSTGTAPVLSNGTSLGRYKQVGKMCTAVWEQVMGTTTTFGTGTWGWSLPVTAASPSGSSSTFAAIGHARGHSATTWYTGAVSVLKGGAVARIYSHGAATEWSPSQPHSWVGAGTNYLHAEVTYETV
ncbi:transcription elongation factor [Streptomyces sp. PvR006]|uniref:hypothetical protein n=1 Tax=Streptomyces sp. PvR006 TaxID=2817860 RepID=UPI001AE8D426|nr:hypothetical protein [Streptomyces sp. PvR006]MBP2583404.1 transcription elongation factor [Streptomyces sp. PvR006]